MSWKYPPAKVKLNTASNYLYDKVAKEQAEQERKRRSNTPMLRLKLQQD